jgi:hypothetical protein
LSKAKVSPIELSQPVTVEPMPALEVDANKKTSVRIYHKSNVVVEPVDKQGSIL